MAVDILILGAGWTSSFLIPLCVERALSTAGTSRTGRESTIPFVFDPDSDDEEPYRTLPDAKTAVITFPITKPGASARLVRLYQKTRTGEDARDTGFIQLGSTGIWEGRNSNVDSAGLAMARWYDRHSPVEPSDRANAEQELLSLSPSTPTSILNLAGLWGGQRDPRNWVQRVAPTKDALKKKGSLHLIHGIDVARAILAIHSNFDKASGQRWLLTDCRIYDWWDLASAWGADMSGGAEGQYQRGPQPVWVRELMREEGIRVLPRGVKSLGRALDSRDFWHEFGLSPAKVLLNK